MFKNINKTLKTNIIGTQNLLKYYFFNKIFKFFFINKSSKFLSFATDGYIKLEKINQNIILKIINEIKQQDPDLNIPSYDIPLNDEIKKLLFDLINNHLNKDLYELEKLYNFKLVLSNLELKRNNHFNKNEHKFESVYSEDYHEDKYICTQIKQFIYLSEVSEKDGPFSFFKINDSKNFIRENNLFNRFSLKKNYRKNINSKNEIFFLGKPGDNLIVDTSECLHRANIPEKGNYRVMLTITYNIVADKKIKSVWSLVDQNRNFWVKKNTNYLSKKLSKPGSYYQLIKIFFSFIFFKILYIKFK